MYAFSCRISPNLQEWTFCGGMMEANVSILYKLSEKYIKPTDLSFMMSLLHYLICLENPDVIITFLNVSLSNDLLTDVHGLIFYYITDNYADNDIILDYLLASINTTVLR